MTPESKREAPQFVDINNLDLVDENIEGLDLEANQYAAPAPPTPGLYHAVLTFASEDPTKRWRQFEYNADKYPQKAGLVYFVTELTGRIVEPGNEFDGRRVRDRFVSTGIFNKPTSAVASLIHLFGRGDELTTNVKEQMRLFEACLAAEPQVTIKTDWEWRGSKREDGTYPDPIKGFKNFPEVEGKVSHIVEDPVTGAASAGYGIITGYRAA